MTPRPVGLKALGVETSLQTYKYIVETNNIFITHIMSFRSVTPKPNGLRPLGVETLLRT